MPVEVVQLTKDTVQECKAFCPVVGSFWGNDHGAWGVIKTLEGDMQVNDRSYIVKGNEGEFWAVKESIFEKTYEPVEEDFSLDDYIGKR